MFESLHAEKATLVLAMVTTVSAGYKFKMSDGFPAFAKAMGDQCFWPYAENSVGHEADPLWQWTSATGGFDTRADPPYPTRGMMSMHLEGPSLRKVFESVLQAYPRLNWFTVSDIYHKKIDGGHTVSRVKGFIRHHMRLQDMARPREPPTAAMCPAPISAMQEVVVHSEVVRSTGAGHAEAPDLGVGDRGLLAVVCSGHVACIQCR